MPFFAFWLIYSNDFVQQIPKYLVIPIFTTFRNYNQKMERWPLLLLPYILLEHLQPRVSNRIGNFPLLVFLSFAWKHIAKFFAYFSKGFIGTQNIFVNILYLTVDEKTILCFIVLYYIVLCIFDKTDDNVTFINIIMVET